MKTILVPTSGTQTDMSVFATALALARSIGGHMEFYHLRLDPCEAALRDPAVQFCRGPAISDTLSYVEKRDKARSADAVGHFIQFCERHQIPILEKPTGARDLSAQWLEETNDPEDRLLFHARHSDITVLGRRHTTDLMPGNLIETLLKKSGRPIVIAADTSARGPIRTVVVGWKETEECARALAAAMPLLTQAERVILLTVREGHGPFSDEFAVTHLARQLEWNGAPAETQILSDSAQPIAQQLAHAARQANADLLVVGGFGHSSVREQVLGGVTRDLVAAAELPVFLMH